MDGNFSVTGSIGGEIKAATGSDTFILEPGSEITAVSGPLTISAPMLVNGKVKANASSTTNSITFTAAPLDGSSGIFEVSHHANARMYFNHPSPVSIGDSGGVDYVVTNGVQTFNESLEVRDGGLQLKSISGSTPKIEVAAGKSFKINGVF